MGKITVKERLEKSIERKRQLSRERVKRYYERKKAQERVLSKKSEKRIVNQLKKILPNTPEKRAVILEKIINSPETSKYLKKNADNLDCDKESKQIATAALNNVKDAVRVFKTKRNDDARTAVNIGISMLCGDNVKTGSLAKEIGISRRRIAMSLQHRKNVLSTETTTPWTFIQRKKGAIPFQKNTGC